MAVDEVLLGVIPCSILPLAAVEGRIRILRRRVCSASSVTLLLAGVDLNLWLLVVEAVSSLLGAIVLVWLDPAARHLILATPEVQLVQICWGHAWLVELVLNSPLVLNIIVAKRTN